MCVLILADTIISTAEYYANLSRHISENTEAQHEISTHQPEYIERLVEEIDLVQDNSVRNGTVTNGGYCGDGGEVGVSGDSGEDVGGGDDVIIESGSNSGRRGRGNRQEEVVVVQNND